MPPDLLKVHRILDLTVMKLYGFEKGIKEADCVAALMGLYQDMTGGSKQ